MKVLLMYAPSPEHEGALHEAAPAARFVAADDERTAGQLIRDADVVLGNRFFLQSLPHARKLRWMQSNSAGVDLILSARSALDGVILTNARGVYDDEVADHALALVLGLARGLHHARDAQRERRWERTRLDALRDRRALVLGWGGIGRGIARRLRAFGVDVEGVRRRARTSTEEFLVHAPDTWRSRLPMTDILVLALPLTPETRTLVGAEELSSLPRSAFVVNVGRAQTLDEGDLFDALRAQRLAGAGLDVLREEPAPRRHPAWTVPNLLLTPHVGRSREKPPYRWEPLFVENMGRFATDKPLVNVVDFDAGY